MFKHKICGLLLLLGLGTTEAGAQIKWRWPQIEIGKPKPTSNRFLLLGSGVGTLAFVDQLTSPRIFSGPMGAMSLGYEEIKSKRMFVSDFMLQGSIADDATPSWGQNIANVIAFRWNMAWMWSLRDADKALQWYAGPALLQYAAIRINPGHGNAAVGYEQSYNLGGRSRLEYRLPLQTRRDYQWWIFKVRKVESRMLRLGWELDLPLFGWQFRPPYNGLLEGVGNDAIAVGAQDIINNSRMELLGSYFHLNSHFYLRYPLRNGNRLQLGYNWMGYSRNYNDMPVRQASGAFTASLMFRLDKQEDIR